MLPSSFLPPAYFHILLIDQYEPINLSSFKNIFYPILPVNLPYVSMLSPSFPTFPLNFLQASEPSELPPPLPPLGWDAVCYPGFRQFSTKMEKTWGSKLVRDGEMGFKLIPRFKPKEIHSKPAKQGISRRKLGRRAENGISPPVLKLCLVLAKNLPFCSY